MTETPARAGRALRAHRSKGSIANNSGACRFTDMEAPLDWSPLDRSPQLTGEIEAAADALTGTVIATAVEGGAPAPATPAAVGHQSCRNCGAQLTGAFCAACGQTAHPHRGMVSIGHEILHGVFHFEGKIWRTLPELFFHPGRLTRRYIDGERVKFVSPMALFLFTVFTMFAVFSFTGGMLVDSSDDDKAQKVVLGPAALDMAKRRTAVAEADRQLAELRRQLADRELTPERRTGLEREIAARTAALEIARSAVAALTKGDLKGLAEIDKQLEAIPGWPQAVAKDTNFDFQTGASTLDRRFEKGIKQVRDNPSFLLYKLKTNGYKYSWALVPLSIPFLWLMFFWRRDVYLYDHAVFVTYSISFVMLLLILCSLAAAVGITAWIWATVLLFAPPIHMYKHLRGTYGLSRFGSVVRLFFVSLAIWIVLSLFGTLLLITGLLD